MKKSFVKVMALVLSFVMVIGLTASSYADDSIVVDEEVDALVLPEEINVDIDMDNTDVESETENEDTLSDEILISVTPTVTPSIVPTVEPTAEPTAKPTIDPALTPDVTIVPVVIPEVTGPEENITPIVTEQAKSESGEIKAEKVTETVKDIEEKVVEAVDKLLKLFNAGPTVVPSSTAFVLPENPDTTTMSVVKADGAEFAMFKLSTLPAYAYYTTSGSVYIKFETSNVSFDKVYFGSKDDSSKVGYATGTARAEGGFSFEFEVPSSVLGNTYEVALGKLDGSWYTNQPLYLTFPAEASKAPAVTPEPTKEPTPEPTAEPTKEPVKVKDGDYNVSAVSNSAMFNIIRAVLYVKDGQMTADITLNGTGYDKVYPGTSVEAESDSANWVPFSVNAEGKYVYTIPVKALDEELPVAAFSTKSSSWFDRTVRFDSESLEKIVEPIANGTYSATATTNSAMFKVIDVVLSVKDENMTAVITLSGTGYDFLYMGTKDEAFADSESNWIPAIVNAEGKYTYEIPVAALDSPLTVASRSARYASDGKGVDAWLDRTITIDASSLELIEKDEPVPTPTEVPTPEPTKVPEKESEHTSDTSGSTSAVDSSTALKDGVYTPDSFSWSGGTGKLSISCNQVTVSGGNAMATLVFSSSKIGYVKANGNTYYPSSNAGGSTFTIPVQLNENNTVIAMTTAMSTAHEVEYTIFVYIANADKASGSSLSDNKKLDDEAPVIAGLKTEGEIKMEHAQYVKIYTYEDGIKLIEVDMTKDTVIDPEIVKDDTDNKDSVKTDAANDKEAGAEEAKTTDEYIADLYKADVIKYLLVPEDKVIPAGLDKQVIIINVPVENAYAASEDIVKCIDAFGKLDSVKAVGVSEEECKLDSLAKALKDGNVVSIGAFDNVDYKELVKNKISVAIGTGYELNEKALKERKLEPNSKDAKKPVEYKEAFTDITDGFTTLGIPVFFDRSADELTDKAKAEWIKVYGALYNDDKAAEQLYKEMTK